MNTFRMQLVILFSAIVLAAPLPAAESLQPFDKQIRDWAIECRNEVVSQFNLLLTSGQLNMAQLFDTFYVPIPGTEPPKFHTRYDALADGVILPIIDGILKRDSRVVYVVIVDGNGYLPTHNSRYTKPLTGDPAADLINNRTKRIFNDRTGRAAAQNRDPYLLQHYSRDTGEEIMDLSVPIVVQNRHWGAVRIGYNRN